MGLVVDLEKTTALSVDGKLSSIRTGAVMAMRLSVGGNHGSTDN